MQKTYFINYQDEKKISDENFLPQYNNLKIHCKSRSQNFDNAIKFFIDNDLFDKEKFDTYNVLTNFDLQKSYQLKIFNIAKKQKKAVKYDIDTRFDLVLETLSEEEQNQIKSNLTPSPDFEQPTKPQETQENLNIEIDNKNK